MTRISAPVILAALWFAPTAFAASTPDVAACGGLANVVLAARAPSVDLFDAPSGGKVVASISNEKFPTCIPVLEQSNAFTLKIQIEGAQYWVQPSTVRFRTQPATCAAALTDKADTKVGATRGLGEGC